MSSLFSIGEDELDLDDEDFLLEACEIEVSRMNKEALSKEAQQVPCGKNKICSIENPSNFNRKPFTSLGNVGTRDRTVGNHKTINMGPANTTKCSGSSTRTSNLTTPGDGVSSGLKSTDTSCLNPPSKRFALEGSGTEVSKSRSDCLVTSVSQNSTCSLSAGSHAPRFSQSGRGHACVGGTGNQVSYTPRRDNSAISRKPLDGNQSLSKWSSSRNTAHIQDNSTAVWPQKSHLSHKEKNSPNGYFCDKPKTRSSGTCNSPNTVYCSSESVDAHCLKFKNHSKTVNNSQKSPAYPSKNLRQRSGCSSVASPRTSIHSRSEETRNQSFSKSQTPHRAGSDFHPQSPIPSIRFEKGGSLKASPRVSPGTPARGGSGPHTTPLSARTPRTRKFPGPAGLLPKLVQGQNLDNVAPVSSRPVPRSPPVQNKISPPNPSDDEEFKRDPWTSMYQDFLQNVPVVMRYSITRVYTEAVQQKLDRGKVPCMCALVKAVSLTEADASVLLKDPTGEIHGTVHHKVLEEYQSELGPGAGLVLKQVSVFSPSPRKHYLNITPGNILQIYAPDPQYVSSSQSTASQASQGKRAVTEQRTEAPVKRVAGESRIIVDSEQIDEIEDTRAGQDAATALEEECIEDLLQGLEDDDIFDEALFV